MVSLGVSRNRSGHRRLFSGLAVTLALGLGLGGMASLVGSLPAGAAVSSVGFSGASMVGGALTNWTVSFTSGPEGRLLAGDAVVATFADGFAIPASPTVVLSTGFSHCSASASTSGEAVTVSLSGLGCTLVPDTPASLVIEGITNPAPDVYPASDFSVATTTDPTPVSPAGSVTITGSGISGVSFAGSTQAAQATGVTWTVSFTTSASGALSNGSKIDVTFASGFGLPANPTVVLVSGFSDCVTPTTGATSGQTVVITLSGVDCSVGASRTATLEIEGIANPTAGVYPAADFSVSTSADTSPVSPAASVSIGTTGISGVNFAGSTQAAQATDVTWTVSFTTSASGALSNGSKIDITFASGFGLPANPTVVLVSGFSDCVSPTTGATSGETVVVTLSGVDCSVGANTTVTLDIEGVANPTAGSYPAADFAVQTSADTTPVSPASAVAIGIAANGSGTLTVSPTAVGFDSTGNVLVFTYIAASGGTSAGTLLIAVPGDWSPPSTVATAAGYTTTTCGTLTVVGSEIEITGMTLGSGDGCTVTYGSEVGGGPGATAPARTEISTFSAAEASVADVTPVALASSPQVSVGSATPLPTQIFGEDPIGTSIAVSEQEFPAPLSAGAVVLSRDDYFTDALAGGPLAAQVDGPLLLTESASQSATIDARTLAEIERVLPVGGTVYVLGGSLALSPGVDTQLGSLGYTVVRLAGADAYTTAVDIAETMGNPGTIFEATATDFFDALSAVPAAIQQHAAILLTDGDQQPLATGLYIYAHAGDTRYAVGGPDEALGADPTAIGVWGTSLFATSAAVANLFFPRAATFGAATALDFPDALAGGVFMATGGRSGPMLLVNPYLPLDPNIASYLATLAVGTQGYVFGGPEAVPGVVVSALQAAVG